MFSVEVPGRHRLPGPMHRANICQIMDSRPAFDAPCHDMGQMLFGAGAWQNRRFAFFQIMGKRQKIPHRKIPVVVFGKNGIMKLYRIRKRVLKAS